MRINFNSYNPIKLITRNNFNQNPTYEFMKNQNIDRFEKQNAQISFKGYPCSRSAFQVKQIPNLPCPVCTKLMLSDEQIETFVDKVYDKKGNDLINALDACGLESFWTGKENHGKTIYRDQKQKVVNAIKHLAHKNPDLDIKGIVRLASKESETRLVSEQINIIAELENYIIANSKDELSTKNILFIINHYKQQITGCDTEKFKRKKFIYSIMNSVPKGVGKSKVRKIIERMPSSTSSVDSFFVKYAEENRGNREIAKNLVYVGKASADHIITQSDKGGDYMENYLCMCSDCNSKRSNQGFASWSESIPLFEENLQYHFNKVQQAINDEVLSEEYDFYVERIIDKIERMTKGKIKLKKPEVAGNIIERRMNKIIGFENEINEIEKQKNIYEETIAELLKEIEIEKDEVQKLNNRMNHVQQELEKLEKTDR